MWCNVSKTQTLVSTTDTSIKGILALQKKICFLGLFFFRKELLIPFKTFSFLKFHILSFYVIIPFPDTAGLDRILAMTVFHYGCSVATS